MKPSRSLFLSTLMLTAIALFGLSSAGCQSKSSPTPTPTKTPTIVPSVTPTPTFPPPTRTAPAAPGDVDHTPTLQPANAPAATHAPTHTPVPPAPTPTDVGQNVSRTALQEEPGQEAGETPPTLTPTKPAAVAGNPAGEQSATPTVQAAPPAGPMPEPVAITDDVNPLTGLKVDPARLNRRPLAIKIPNFPVIARPQSGISLADVVIEHEAEAYLTRFTAIFWGNDASLVGPIRSLRLTDAELVPLFKAVLVASGGHPAVKIRITEGKPWAAGYRRIICPEPPFLGDGGAEYRLPDKKPRYELTMYSDTASLWNVCTQRGINQRPDFNNMFVFSDLPPGGGRDATHLKIVYKPTFSETEYRYDPASHTYKRFDLGQPTIDELTGKQVAPSNVVVLYANHVDSDIPADTHDPNHTWYAEVIQLWGQGPARLMRDGKVYDCAWVRENPQQENDRLILLDGAGNQVPFRPGTTWIQLVRLDGNVTID